MATMSNTARLSAALCLLLLPGAVAGQYAVQAPALRSAAMDFAEVDPVTPWQVFRACEIATATTGSPQSNEMSKMASFCRNATIPGRLSRLTRDQMNSWTTLGLVPTREEVAAIASMTEFPFRGERILKLLNAFDQLQFPTGVDTLTDAQKGKLVNAADSLLKALRLDPSAKFRVVGQADAAGSERANFEVARSRAESIVRELVRLGVPDSALMPIGLVKEQAGRPVPRAADRIGKLELAPSAAPALQTTPTVAAPVVDYTGVSTVLMGITNALIEKAEADIQVYLLKKVADKACLEGRFHFLRTCLLFPDSAALQGEVQAYTPTIAQLRSALESDLRSLPPALLHDYVAGRLLTDSVRPYAVAALYAIDGLARFSEGQNLNALLTDFPSWLNNSGLDSGIIDQIKKDSMYLLVSELGGLIAQADSARAQLAPYYGSADVAVDTVLTYTLRAAAVNAHNSSLPQRLTGIVTALRASEDVRSEIVALNKTLTEMSSSALPDSVLRGRKVQAFSTLALKALDGISVLLEYGLPDTHSARWAKLRTDALPKVIDIAAATALQDYRRAIHGTLTVLSDFSPSFANDVKCARTLWITPTSTAPKPPVKPCATVGPPIPPKYIGLVAFASDISQAKSEEEVKSAFTGYLGTQGTRAEKRTQVGDDQYYWSVNSYVGAQGGFERLRAPGKDNNDGAAFSFYIPIGVELGKRIGKQWTMGLFLQPFDLGAIASLRSGSSTEQYNVQSEVSLAQIIVPGMGLIFGVGDSPASFGVVGAYSPEARKSPEVGKLDAVRLSFILGVDIPLFR